MAQIESALVIPVPQAEALVGPLRERFEPSASLGAPAHITLLYPFIDPRQIDDRVLNILAACFRTFTPIEFSLSAIRRFPTGTLYLALDPDEPFRALTRAIWKLFPDTPPYSGHWPDIVPHLSIGQFADEGEVERVADELGRACKDALPASARATDVALIDNSTGRWTRRSTFRLGN
jgi:2'-5' RNA ligase